jgi:hypothetical protein
MQYSAGTRVFFMLQNTNSWWECTKHVRETRHVSTLLGGTHKEKTAIGRDSPKNKKILK